MKRLGNFSSFDYNLKVKILLNYFFFFNLTENNLVENKNRNFKYFFFHSKYVILFVLYEKNSRITRDFL